MKSPLFPSDMTARSLLVAAAAGGDQQAAAGDQQIAAAGTADLSGRADHRGPNKRSTAEPKTDSDAQGVQQQPQYTNGKQSNYWLVEQLNDWVHNSPQAIYVLQPDMDSLSGYATINGAEITRTGLLFLSGLTCCA